MRHEQDWQPSKFAHRAGCLSAGPGASDASWLISQLVAQAFERHLKSHVRGRLLDLGCGAVPLYAAYRPLVHEITCVDWAGSAHVGLHVDIAHDLNQPLPLEDSRYDTVILSDVLEHIRRPEELVGEVARILAPGGKLLASMPFMYWLHEQPHDYFRYSEHALRSFMDQARLRVLVLEHLGSAPDVLADIVGKHLALVPGLGSHLARALQRGVWSLTHLRVVAHALQPSSQRFPLGYFLVAEKL